MKVVRSSSCSQWKTPCLMNSLVPSSPWETKEAELIKNLQEDVRHLQQQIYILALVLALALALLTGIWCTAWTMLTWTQMTTQKAGGGVQKQPRPTLENNTEKTKNLDTEFLLSVDTPCLKKTVEALAWMLSTPQRPSTAGARPICG